MEISELFECPECSGDMLVEVTGNIIARSLIGGISDDPLFLHTPFFSAEERELDFDSAIELGYECAICRFSFTCDDLYKYLTSPDCPYKPKEKYTKAFATCDHKRTDYRTAEDSLSRIEDYHECLDCGGYISHCVECCTITAAHAKVSDAKESSPHAHFCDNCDNSVLAELSE